MAVLEVFLIHLHFIFKIASVCFQFALTPLSDKINAYQVRATRWQQLKSNLLEKGTGQWIAPA